MIARANVATVCLCTLEGRTVVAAAEGCLRRFVAWWRGRRVGYAFSEEYELYWRLTTDPKQYDRLLQLVTSWRYVPWPRDALRGIKS